MLSRFGTVFSIFVAFDAMLAVTSCPSRVWIFSTFSFILSSEFACIIGFDRPFSFLIRDQWTVVWPQEHGSSRAMIKQRIAYCGIGIILKDSAISPMWFDQSVVWLWGVFPDFTNLHLIMIFLSLYPFLFTVLVWARISSVCSNISSGSFIGLPWFWSSSIVLSTLRSSFDSGLILFVGTTSGLPVIGL